MEFKKYIHSIQEKKIYDFWEKKDLFKPISNKLKMKLTIFLKKHQIEVAGVEFIRNKDGVPIFYDINTNTNYNLNAEKQSKVNKNGMEEIALFLKSELDKISI